MTTLNDAAKCPQCRQRLSFAMRDTSKRVCGVCRVDLIGTAFPLPFTQWVGMVYWAWDGKAWREVTVTGEAE